MENRTITIVSTRDQKRSTVNTNATTLAELKSALRTAGIDYEGMTFYEGLTHTELLTDDSILPHDVEYKGETTNNLVFMLTNPNKKIKSGALSEARQALYNEIHSRELEAKVMETYGRSFTQCKNSELAAVIEENTPAEVDNNVAEAVKVLVDILWDEDYLSCSEKDRILAVLNGVPAPAAVYSDAEVDDMFDFVR